MAQPRPVGPVDARMRPPEAPCRYLLETFVPMLLDFGLDEASIEHLLVDNPRSLFENAAGSKTGVVDR